MAQGCKKPWASAVRAGDVNVRIREAVFGLEPGEVQLIAMCREHYRQVHRADGYTLGYHLRGGKIKAYVIAEHY